MTAKKTAKHSAPEASDADIATLAHGAAKGRDHQLVRLCARALMGNKPARRECSRIVHASRHMQHTKGTA